MVEHHSCGYVDKLSDRKIVCSVTRDGLHLAVQVFAIQRSFQLHDLVNGILKEPVILTIKISFPIDDILQHKLIKKFITKI